MGRYGKPTEELRKTSLTLAGQKKDFDGEAEIIEVRKEIRIQERINGLRKQTEARKTAEYWRRIQGNTSPRGPPGPRIKTLEIVKWNFKKNKI